MEGTIGAILMFAGNFAPKNWAFCNGQIISIQQNTALFSILGTTYGGNGTTTFALPDMRCRVPVGTGQGPGLGNVTLGEMAGSAGVSLTINNLPAHNHTATTNVGVSSTNASSEEPAGNVLATQPGNVFAAANTANGSMGGVTTTIGIAGSSQPFDNHQPYIGMNFVVCMYGIFPSRN